MSEKVYKYRAIRACFHGQNLYQPGQEYNPTPYEVENDVVPEHFVKERDFSQEAVDQAEITDRERTAVVKPMKKEDFAAEVVAKGGQKIPPAEKRPYRPSVLGTAKA